MADAPLIRLALTEDHTPTRHVLHAHLATLPGVSLVASVGSGEALLDALDEMDPEELPHVVLMDIELPGLNGIDATRLLKTRHPGVDVLMLTVFDAEEVIFQAIQAGASGYLLKDERAEIIHAACHDLVGGGAPMSASIARKALRLLRTAPPPAPDDALNPLPYLLSEREQEVLEGLVDGHSYASLAEQLFLSPHTVRTHIKNIYKKLHVHSRAAAVQVALRQGKR